MTFSEELESVGGVPGLLWGTPSEFRDHKDPLRAICDSDANSYRKVDKPTLGESLTYPADEGDAASEDVALIDNTNYFRTVDPFALDEVLLLRIRDLNGDSFRDKVMDLTGLDLAAVKSATQQSHNARQERLANLTHKFGMEAFGTYLPWHAFARSSTPWGIYLLPIRIAEWTWDLLKSAHLPRPKPSWERLFFTMLWVTYRHELFHWHVETFALAHEVLVRRPVYRPYVERVEAYIRLNTPESWWEEALAQAVVLESRLLQNRSGFRLTQLRKFLVPDFKTRFPDGYRHFECTAVGGPDNAHRIFSAQVARTQLGHAPKSTALALAKDHYAKNDSSVPGYLCFSVQDYWQFQLAPVKTRHFDAYVVRKGGRFSPGPGDHRVLTIGSARIHVNAGGNRDEVDLASLKATARILGTTIHRLSQEMRG